jgi:hypothetical protein
MVVSFAVLLSNLAWSIAGGLLAVPRPRVSPFDGIFSSAGKQFDHIFDSCPW